MARGASRIKCPGALGPRGVLALAGATGLLALAAFTAVPAVAVAAVPFMNYMPVDHPGTTPPFGFAPGELVGAATRSSPLTYYGGPLISNVKVVEVVYGTGLYIPQVTSTGTPSVGSFFAGVTNSQYIDWLGQYDKTQRIGRGTFGGRFTITPAAADNGATVTDTEIQAELAAQIAAGHLPKPVTDSTGHVNTLYTVYFRRDQMICDGTGYCSGIQFCGYHGSFLDNGQEILYTVEPDLFSISGCGTGNAFQNTTSVQAHELIESITDPEIAQATNFAPPLGWYNASLGEIADICNGQHATVVGGDGVTYTVQKGWSNSARACVS